MLIKCPECGRDVSDKEVDMPLVKHTNATFKRAPKNAPTDSHVIELAFDVPRPLLKVAEEPAQYTAKPPKKPKRKKQAKADDASSRHSQHS